MCGVAPASIPLLAGVLFWPPYFVAAIASVSICFSHASTLIRVFAGDSSRAFATDPGADFNGDHVVNSQDFFDFLTAFFAGCS